VFEMGIVTRAAGLFSAAATAWWSTPPSIGFISHNTVRMK
jgi:hypothetical protein